MKQYRTITSMARMLSLAIIAVGFLVIPVHDTCAAQRMVLGEYFTNTY